jgi:hypothetical protein
MAQPNIRLHTSYLGSVLTGEGLRETVDAVLAFIEKNAERIGTFDAIAYTGHSGALVAPIVAMELRKNLIVVRKNGENAHSSKSCEGPYGGARYIIVDDFVATGRTVRRIVETIQETFTELHRQHDDECVCTFECICMRPTYECAGVIEYMPLTGDAFGSTFAVNGIPVFTYRAKGSRYSCESCGSEASVKANAEGTNLCVYCRADEENEKQNTPIACDECGTLAKPSALVSSEGEMICDACRVRRYANEPAEARESECLTCGTFVGLRVSSFGNTLCEFCEETERLDAQISKLNAMRTALPKG